MAAINRLSPDDPETEYLARYFIANEEYPPRCMYCDNPATVSFLLTAWNLPYCRSCFKIETGI